MMDDGVLGGLLEQVYEQDALADLDRAERRLALRALVAKSDVGDREVALERLVAAVDGYGAIDPLLDDPTVTDVLINGPGTVWVERAGRVQPTEVALSGPAVAGLVERLAAAAGTRVDLAKPIADGRLPNGSRVHIVLPPVASTGPLVSIRQPSGRRYTLAQLAERGMLGPTVARALREAVAQRMNIAIGGGTGTGKTTLLNALLGCVGDAERVVVIEAVPELEPSCAHWVSLVERPPSLEGGDAIGSERLLREALRMRPDRVVVGEVRGVESLVALDAVSIGHRGSMVTVHAGSAADALGRLVSLAHRAHGAPGLVALRDGFRRHFDLIVHLERSQTRGRSVAEIIWIG